MENREQSARYEGIGRELMASEPLVRHVAGRGVKVAFLASDKAKTSNRKAVYAECEKVPAKYRWAIPYDFTVTVFGPNVERLTDAQLRVLILHELMHIGVDEDGNDASFFVRPHDVEDFHEIIDRYGIDWSE